MDHEEGENIAATLKRILPTAEILSTVPLRGVPARFDVAVPDGFRLETIDLSKLAGNPARATTLATFSDLASFVAYLKAHQKDTTVAWALFNPQTYALSFSGVIDDHTSELPGWREHKTAATPDMSVEWKTWLEKDRKPFEQVAFAEFIEANSDDIVASNSLPTSLQMLKMATEFQYHENRALKSAVRLESGGVNLTYVADPDKGTLEQMKIFDKFSIGIPVFQGGPAYGITARLKYRVHAAKVTFFYELIRTDRVHLHAATELIDTIRSEIASIPLYLGACK